MTLASRLTLSTPMIQAPMAGASHADFVIKACQLGVLGSLGAGMMSPDDINKEIDKIKAGTDKAFNINLMILGEEVIGTYSQSMPDWLAGLYEELGVTPKPDERPAHDFAEQLAVLLNNPVPVASFTFGILEKAQIKSLHAVGTLVIGTANSVAEVMAWQEVGADAVVVQGKEAGGHQGGWMDENGEKLSTSHLLTLARQRVSLPLIAAGGISRPEHVEMMMAQGADMVMMGTVFLTTIESPIHALWKKRLLSAEGSDTRLTKLYSGKWARGIITEYMRRFHHLDNANDLPIYPTLNAMTKSLRAHGAATNNAEMMSLWSGTGVADCRDESMSELVARLKSVSR